MLVQVKVYFQSCRTSGSTDLKVSLKIVITCVDNCFCKHFHFIVCLGEGLLPKLPNEWFYRLDITLKNRDYMCRLIIFVNISTLLFAQVKVYFHSCRTSGSTDLILPLKIVITCVDNYFCKHFHIIVCLGASHLPQLSNEWFYRPQSTLKNRDCMCR